MTIKIELKKEGSSGICSGRSTRVFNDKGSEIKNITSINILIDPNAIVTATVDVRVSSLTEMENIHALLGTKTLHDIAKLHNYELKRIGVIGSHTELNVKKS